MALRHWAVATLGEHFRSIVDVRPGQPVVRTGFYRACGIPPTPKPCSWPPAPGSPGPPPAHLVPLCCTLAGMLHRIHAEDTVLTASLGSVYASGTARLIPGVW